MDEVARSGSRRSAATGKRGPGDRAGLLLAGLLVACSRPRPPGADRTRVKVTDALACSVGLAISAREAAAIFRQDLKLTVIRACGNTNYVVGLTPAAVSALWTRVR